MTNKTNHLQIKLQTLDQQPEALDVNPATSFYVQADGSVIGSIMKLFKNKNCSPTCYSPEYSLYGDTIMTSPGETWIFDPGKGKYIKK